MKGFVHFLIFPLLILGTACVSRSSHTNYYFDSVNGKDGNSGMSPSHAFRSLKRISQISLHPGDRILLRGGQIFSGTIRLRKISGNRFYPVVVSAYGPGRATISSGDSTAIIADSCHYLVIQNLRVIGSGRLQGNRGDGILFNSVDHGRIDSAEACGYLRSGIHVRGGGNIRLTHLYAHNNGFCGIYAESGAPIYGADGSAFKTLKKVYIGYCVARNNPGCPVIADNHSGSGILMAGVVQGLIEYCEASENGWDMPREGNGPVGIWAYMSDSLVIQHCYSHHNKTSPHGKDGGGFDFDGGVTRSIMQYNLSAWNEGAGYGLFQYAGATDWSVNTIRFNISFHDGLKNSHAGLYLWCDKTAVPMHNCMIYCNTIVNKESAVNTDPGVYNGFEFRNNIFQISGNNNHYLYGILSGILFRHNLYWSERYPDGRQTPIKVDGEAILLNPKIQLPVGDSLRGINANNLRDLLFFRLPENSPVLEVKTYIGDSGSADFWGRPVNPNGMVNPGAWQAY